MSTSTAPGARHSIGFDFTKTDHSDTYDLIDSTKADLSGRNVLIAGASRGIGRGIAVSFAKAGASAIVLAARSSLADTEAAVLAAAKAANRTSPTVLSLRVDVVDIKSVAAAAEEIKSRLGHLDVVVNNAGASEAWTPITEGDPEHWWSTFETNVRGPYLLSRIMIPLLAGPLKTVVNVGSIGQNVLVPGGSSYQTSKLALARLSEFIALECGANDVLAFTIHPGGVATKMSLRTLPEDLRYMLIDTPELAGDAVVFLTKEKRSWLAGRYISVKWDMQEILDMKDEIVKRDLLKIRMAVGGGQNNE